MIEKIVYFEKMGRINTETTLNLVKKKVEAKGITSMVIASHTGFTAKRALQVFEGMDIFMVFVGSDRVKFSAEILKKVEAQGHKVLFTSEGNIRLPDLANTVLRRFCEGMRVVILIMMVAVDQKAIPTDKQVIVVAGTGPFRFEEEGGGADTAVVMHPCTYDSFFKPRYYKQDRRSIREIICKPL